MLIPKYQKLNPLWNDIYKNNILEYGITEVKIQSYMFRINYYANV